MDARELLNDLARRAGLPGLPLSPRGTAQLLLGDSGMTLNFEPDPDSGLLHAFVALGPLPRGSAGAELMRGLLRLNLHSGLRGASGGGHWALDGSADDGVLLHRALVLDGLTGEALEQAVLALAEGAQAGLQLIGGPPSGGTSTAPLGQPGFA